MSTRDIPITSSFVSKGNSQSSWIEYQKLVDKAKEYHTMMLGYAKNGMTKEMNEYRNQEMQNLYNKYNSINKQMKGLWNEIDNAKTSKEADVAQDKQEAKMKELIDYAKTLKLK